MTIDIFILTKESNGSHSVVIDPLLTIKDNENDITIGLSRDEIQELVPILKSNDPQRFREWIKKNKDVSEKINVESIYSKLQEIVKY
jgi:hypothetical protein